MTFFRAKNVHRLTILYSFERERFIDNIVFLKILLSFEFVT